MHFKALFKAIKNVKYWVGTLEIEKEDGKYVWLRAIFQPVLDIKERAVKEFTLDCNDLPRTITSSREDEGTIAAFCGGYRV